MSPAMRYLNEELVARVAAQVKATHLANAVDLCHEDTWDRGLRPDDGADYWRDVADGVEQVLDDEGLSIEGHGYWVMPSKGSGWHIVMVEGIAIDDLTPIDGGGVWHTMDGCPPRAIGPTDDVRSWVEGQLAWIEDDPNLLGQATWHSTEPRVTLGVASVQRCEGCGAEVFDGEHLGVCDAHRDDEQAPTVHEALDALISSAEPIAPALPEPPARYRAAISVEPDGQRWRWEPAEVDPERLALANLVGRMITQAHTLRAQGRDPYTADLLTEASEALTSAAARRRH